MSLGIQLREEFTRGDTYYHPVLKLNEGGVQYIFSSADTVILRIWDKITGVTLIEKEITDFTDGAINPMLTKDETKLLDFKIYGYEIEWTNPEGVVFTIVRESDIQARKEAPDKVVE